MKTHDLGTVKWAIGGIGVCLALASGMVVAQSVTTIKTDTSWGRTGQTLTPSSSNTVVTGNQGATYAIPGKVYTITEAQGKLAGANLFHSFESFSIGTGDAAVFTTTTPTLNNVVSRVSGSSPTMINGLLALVPAAGSNPNFFFVNPNGVTFGVGAQVDVPAAFHVSTADHLRFADGTLFKAGNGSDSTFSIAPPEAFGFLGTRRAPVNVVEGTVISTWPGAPISIAAGDILVDGAGIVTGAAGIRLAAIGQAQVDVPLVGPLPAASGNLIVRNGAQVVAYNWDPSASANLEVSAGNVLIDGGGIPSGLFTLSIGAGNAGKIVANVQDTLYIFSSGQILSSTVSTGDAGSVTIAAQNILLDRGGAPSFTGIGSQTDPGSTGNAAKIDLTVADTLALFAGAQINASSFGAGDTGSVHVSTGTFYIDGWRSHVPTGIGIQSLGTGTGATTSRIDVAVRDDLTILNGGTFSSSSFTARDGGSISVRAGNITLQGNDAQGSTGFFTDTEGAGRGGDLTVAASGDIQVLLGSEISASTFGSGNAGALKLTASNLLIDGMGSRFFTGISGNAAARSAGNAGGVNVAASDFMVIRNGGEISSSTFSSGNAGPVEVSARNLVIDGMDSPLFTGIASDAGANSTGGNSGSIKVTVTEALSVWTGGEIATSTFSSGNAGSIVINAGSVLLNDNDAQSVTGVFSNTYGAGHAGNISVSSAGNVDIQSRANIASGSFASGDGGSIFVAAQNVTIEGDGSSIVAQAESSSTASKAGSIEVNAVDAFTIRSGGIVSTSTLSAANAGSIAIAAHSVLVSGLASIVQSTTQAAGQGGSILISASQMRVEQLGDINAEASGTGNAGNISMTGDSLAVMSGGRVEASTFGAGKGGSIAIAVTGDVTVAGVTVIGQTGFHSGLFAGTQIDPIAGSGTPAVPGSGGNISIVAKNVVLSDGGQIDSSTTSGGAGGSVAITARQNFTVAGTDTRITSDAASGDGPGGNILISASQMTVEQSGNITAQTSGKGKAGNVTLTGDQLSVMSGGRIEASTSGAGKGGSIAVTVTGDVIVSGVNANSQTDSRSGLFAKTQTPSTGTGGGGGGAGGGGTGGGGTGGGTGNAPKPGSAGNISIAANNLLLNDGAQIDSSTTSGGAGGSVAITARGDITIAGTDTRLTSDATRGDGPGGNITMVAKNITISDGASVTAATGGKGDAGNINLATVDQLLMQSGGKVTTSTSGAGKGGSVVIQAGRVLLDGADTAIVADTLRPFADLTITINILHGNDGDLIVQLQSPTGTRVALLSRVGGSGDNFIGTTFDDQATKPITAGSASFTGTFNPREPLSQLINELTSGNWVLNVRDQATGNAGTLQNWTLQIGQQTFQSTGAPLPIPDNGTLQSTITVTNPAVSTIQGTGQATGIGGDVFVNAGSLTVQNGATMSAITRGSGGGGIVNLQVCRRYFDPEQRQDRHR